MLNTVMAVVNFACVAFGMSALLERTIGDDTVSIIIP
jgi:hypothetical protein